MTWDPVHDSRTSFLACLRAQCAPGHPHGPVPAAGLDDDPVLDTAAAVLLALLDPGLGLCVLGTRAEAVGALLRERTGAHAADPGDADFVLVGRGALGAPGLARTGGASTPERGATLVYCATEPTSVLLSGPGLEHPEQVTLCVPAEDLVALRMANGAPPAGLDVLVAGVVDGQRVVTALPRSTTVVLEEG